ncbi:MAG: hypothetical protein WCO26_17475 [Deltaproteobacteria bacterium]
MDYLYEPTRVFILVKTYPHPSKKYQEVVCTAGVTEENQWVRLYPIDYRVLPPEQRFEKYQWIEVKLSSSGAANDKRKESRRPDVNSIRVFGDTVPSDHGWEQRRQIVDKLPVHTLNELEQLYEPYGVSLGVVRPSEVKDLKIEETDEEWDAKYLEQLKQLHLFGEQRKHLRKIPYNFTYQFKCDDDSKWHQARLLDWEMGVLWLKEVNRLKDEKKAAESVKRKFLDEICSPQKDTLFFMGTRLPFNSWMVLGVFWPPRRHQLRLF